MRAATFTTYINATTDPGLEAAFDRQTRVATNSYAVITQAAKEATRATAGLLGGRGTAGIATVSRALDGQARSTNAVTAAAAASERQAARTTTSMRREADVALRAAQTHQNLSRSLNTTATAFSVVEGRMSPLAGRMVTVANAAERLTGLQLGLAGVGATLFALGRAGNEYAVLASRLRPFYNSQEEANRAMNDVVGIAQRSRSALEPVVEIYARLKSQTDSLGISQQRIGRITEIASKAATLSGGTRQAREGALVQFSQALGANFRGAGQEFASLQEGAPLLLKAIADGYKNVDGSIGTTIGNIRKLGEQGKLTSRDVADALERSALRIDSMFANLPKTLGVAGTEFSNALTVMVGRFDQTVGLTNALANGISAIASNLRAVTALAVGAGAAFASIKIGNLVQQGAANLQSIRAQQAMVKELDAAWIRDAEITAAAYAARQRELEAERVQLRSQIVEITRRAQAEEAAAAETVAAVRARAAANVAAYEAEGRAAAATALAARGAGGAAVTGSTTVRGRTYPTITTTGGAMGKLDVAATKASEEAARGQAAALALQAENADRAAKRQLELRAVQERLTGVNRELGATTKAVAGAQESLGRATANVASRVGFLRTAGSSLVSFLGGPWGIAFAAATTAVYLLATAESAAEAATRKAEAAQRDFANAVDRTTGKIYDQIGATQRLALARQQNETGRASFDQARQTGGQIVQQLRPLLGSGGQQRFVTRNGFRVLERAPDRRTPEQRILAEAVASFQRGEKGALPRLESIIARQDIRRGVPGLNERVDNLGGLFGALGQRIRETTQAAARQRVISGNPREGDLAKAFGEQQMTTTGGGQARTKAQIEAEAKARAARTDLQRAQADLAKIRAEGKLATETEDQYIDRLAAAQQAVRSAHEAEKDRRKAQTAGAAAARKEARDALQDAKDAAAATRDAALLDLEKRKPSMGQQEYLQARIAILSTYDSEVNKLDASAAASNRAAAQMIADAKAVAAASARAGEKRSDILGGYEDAPKAIIKARDQIDDLQKLVGQAMDGITEISEANPLGTGVYTQEMADADARRIEQGVRKPIKEANREAERGMEIARLQLMGRDAEAEALRRTYQLVDDIGAVSYDEYLQKLQHVQAEQRINDLLESRQRIVGLIQGAANDARDTVERFITDLPSGLGNAAGNALKAFQQRFLQINARQLTERLFAGTDAKVRELLTGKTDVDGAMRQYISTLGTAESGTAKLASATEQAAQRIDAATRNLGVPTAGVGGTDVGAMPGNIGAVAANTLAGGSTVAAGLVAVASAAAGRAATKAANDNGTATAAQDIIVTGTRVVKQAQQALSPSRLPSSTEVYRTLGKSIGSNIDDALHGIFGSGKKNADGSYDTSKGGLGGLGNTTFFNKLGDKLGGALAGAATGSMVSGISNSLGIKMSNTGAQIGGAIGNFIPIPGGKIIGSIAGGLLGNLFKKTPKGAVNITGMGDAGMSYSGSGKYQDALTGNAGTIQQQLSQIADALGADLGNFGVSFGKNGDWYHVSGQVGADVAAKHPKSPLIYEGKDEAKAIEAAIRDALADGAIRGISAASQRILQSGQDIQKAINKALAIESIPKRLLQLTDPVRYAVTTLNDEFTKLISYLKEGGATAEQFADAQKLYDLERAEAIKQAMKDAGEAIDDFLKEMTGGASSPYNKLTTYNNAAAELDKFRGDIAAGKAVDQNDLLTAARNFQDASRGRYGSSTGFFDDFNMLRSLLEKARDNAGISNTDVTTLPGSPFASDSAVQAAIAKLQGASTEATQTQTAALTTKLDQLIDAVNGLGGGGGGEGSGGGGIGLLPGFGNVKWA